MSEEDGIDAPARRRSSTFIGTQALRRSLSASLAVFVVCFRLPSRSTPSAVALTAPLVRALPRRHPRRRLLAAPIVSRGEDGSVGGSESRIYSTDGDDEKNAEVARRGGCRLLAAIIHWAMLQSPTATPLLPSGAEQTSAPMDQLAGHGYQRESVLRLRNEPQELLGVCQSFNSASKR